MYIQSIEIYGFGKFVNKIITFEKDFNTIIGQNEEGKSTIQQFIKSILFGFSSKKNTNNYESKIAKVHGGKVVLANTKYGILYVERVKKDKKESLKIISEKGEELDSSILDEVLSFIDREVYERFFSINLNNLSALSTLSKDDVSRYFLTMGIEGSDRLFDFSDRLQKQLDKLYKKRGVNPPLNEQLESYQKYVEQLKIAQTHQKDYANLKIEQQQLEIELQKIKEEKINIKTQIQQLENLERLKDTYQQYQSLVKSYDNRVENITSEEFEQYLSNEKEIDLLLKQQSQYKLQEQENNQSLKILDNANFNWYLNHRTYCKNIIQSLPKVEKCIQEMVTVSSKLDDKKIFLKQEKEKYNIDDIPNIDHDFYESVKQLEKKYVAYQMQLEHLAKQQANNRDQLDNVYQKKDNKSLTNYLLTLGGLVSTIISVLLNQWLFSSIIGVITIIIFLWQYNKNITENKKVQKEIAKQLAIKENITSQIETIHRHQQQIIDSFNDEKRQFNIPFQITMTDIVNHALTNLIHLDKDVKTLMSRFNELEQEAKNYITLFDEFSALLPKSHDDKLMMQQLSQLCVSFKYFIDEMRHIEVKYISYQEKKNLLNRDSHQLQDKIISLNNAQSQIRAKVELDTEEQFIATIYRNKQIKIEMTKLEQILNADKRTFDVMDNLDGIRQSLVDSKKKLDALEERTQQQNEKIALCLTEIKRLEEFGVYESLNQQVAIEEEKTKNLIIQYASYAVSKKMIDTLLTKGNVDYLDMILQKVSELFFTITTKYEKVVYDKNQLVVLDTYKNQFFIYELSQGAKEQLYIAFRLAIVDLVQEKVNLPIFIDDCFVNFDKKRRCATLDVLLKMSRTHQIIYTTFNEEMAHQKIIRLG